MIKDIGYTKASLGLIQSCSIVNYSYQSPDIAQGVNRKGAETRNDVRLRYKHTDTYMPMPLQLSHNILKQLAEIREPGMMTYLGPDSRAKLL